METFRPGQSIVLREVLGDGRAWATYAGISVRDDGEWIATYVPSGAPIMAPIGPQRAFDRAADPADIRWERRAWHTTNALLLARPGEPWTTRLYWDAGTWEFRYWYINLETPLRRAANGFETLDHELDIVVHPDLTIEWKDEDVLEEWVQAGAFIPAQADQFRVDGERALELVHTRAAPFDGSWQDWRPDPAWARPTMPDDWHGGRTV